MSEPRVPRQVPPEREGASTPTLRRPAFPSQWQPWPGAAPALFLTGHSVLSLLCVSVQNPLL